MDLKLKEDAIIFQGSPRIRVGDNEMVGEEILITNNQQNVQVIRGGINLLVILWKKLKRMSDYKNLVTKNISKSYKGRQVVKSVSLEVNLGEIVGLLDLNGAGKLRVFIWSWVLFILMKVGFIIKGKISLSFLWLKGLKEE